MGELAAKPEFTKAALCAQINVDVLVSVIGCAAVGAEIGALCFKPAEDGPVPKFVDTVGRCLHVVVKGVDRSTPVDFTTVVSHLCIERGEAIRCGA